MYYVCHTVHYIILRERVYVAVARTELTLFLQQACLAQCIVVIRNPLTDVIALFDFRGGVKGRENKKSCSKTDTDVEIQITHTPANHVAHWGGGGQECDRVDYESK